MSTVGAVSVTLPSAFFQPSFTVNVTWSPLTAVTVPSKTESKFGRFAGPYKRHQGTPPPPAAGLPESTGASDGTTDGVGTTATGGGVGAPNPLLSAIPIASATT